MIINKCEVTKDKGRNPAWKIYAPLGEHFTDCDTHVYVEWSKDEAIAFAEKAKREKCPEDCSVCADEG